MTVKNLTIKIDADLGSTNEAINKVNTALAGTGAKLRDIVTTSSQVFNGTALVTTNKQVLQIAASTKKMAEEAKRAIDILNSTSSGNKFTSIEKEYAKRAQQFQSTLTEMQNKLRSDIAIQKAIQQEGANSITAIKLRQAEEERKIQAKLQSDLLAIQQRFQAGQLNRGSYLASSVPLLRNAREATLRLNQATIDQVATIRQQTAAVNTSNDAHRSFFLRVAEGIGTYKALSFAINLVQSGLKAIPNIGIQKEATLSALSSTVGLAGVDSAFKALTEEANRSGQAIQTVRENFKTFQASTSLAGESLKDVWTMFTNINTTATALHLSTDKVQLVFLALSQIFNKTKVQSEELVKQLGNLLPGAFSSYVEAYKNNYNKLGEAIGRVAISHQQAALMIVKSMKAGTQTAHENILNFTNFYAQRFSAAFESADKGLLASTNRMSNSFIALGEALYTINSGPLLAVTKSLGSLAEYLTEAVKGTNALGRSFDTVLNIALGASLVALGNFILSLNATVRLFASATLAVEAFQAKVVATSAVTATLTSGLGLLKGAFAFLSSPTVILTGIAAIAFHLRDLEVAAVNAQNAVEARFNRLNATISAKTPEQKLELEISQNQNLLDAKKELADIEAQRLDHQTGFHIKNDTYLKREVELNNRVNIAKENIVRTEKLLREQLNAENAEAAKRTAEMGTLDLGGNKINTKEASAAAKVTRDLYADILRDSKIVSDSIKNDIQELTNSVMEKLSSVEKGTFTEQYALIKDYYDKKLSLIERDTAAQLEALYTARDIAAQQNDIAKQAEFSDKITALAGNIDTQTTGSAAKEEIALLKEKQRLLQAVDKQEIDQKRELLQTTETAQQAFEVHLAKLNELYASVDSKGKAVLSNAEYLSGLSKLNTNFNIAKDKELSNPIDRAVPAIKRYNDYVKEVTKNTKQLGATNSGTYNAALGGINLVLGAVDELAKAQNKYNDALAANASKYNDALIAAVTARYDTEEERILALHTLREENAKVIQEIENAQLSDALSGARQLIGATYKLFDAKSSTAKALYAIEQGIAAAQLAFQAVAMAKTLATLPIKIASGVAELFAEGGWAGFAGAAAFLALLAGIGYSGGGGSGTKPPEASPTTGSVLGDPGKSSESLQNVEALLKDIHAKEYRELQGINEGVTLMSQGITNALTRAYQVPGAGSGVYDPVVKGLGTTAPGFSNPTPSGLIDNIVGKALFGGGTTKSIIAGGILTAGIQISELLAGALVGAAQYSVVETVKKGGLLSKTKKSIETILTQIDPTIQEAFTDIFKSVGETLLSVSSSLELGLEDKIINTIIPSITLALRGLSSEDAAKAVNAAINTLIDNISTNIFGELLGEFQKLGEGMFETVSRLAIDLGVVKNSFQLIDVSFNLTGVEAIRLAETMVTSAGSLQDLRTSFEDFFSAFLSEQEQQQYHYESLAITLQDMNLILPETREGWKVLVQTMLAGGNATATTAANLLQLTKVADAYYQTLEKSQSALLEGLFGAAYNVANTIAENTQKQQALIIANPDFQNAGVTAGATTEQLQEQIAQYLKQSGSTMASLLEYIKSHPELRAAVDAFVALAASNSSATPEDTSSVANSAAQSVVDKFITSFTALIARLTAILTVTLNANSSLTVIQDAMDQVRAAYQTAQDDLIATYATITDGLRTKMYELNDAIAEINISLITNPADKAAAEAALFQQQRQRLYAQLNQTIVGESAQAMYDRQISTINSLQSLIQSRYDAEVASIKEVTSAIDSIHDHINSLLLDTNLSPLSNAQRLAEAKGQFDATIAAAKAGDTTALNNVNSALDAYLTEARGFYASSTDYQNIFYSATLQANSLTAGLQTTEQQIATLAAETVKELQDLQSKLSAIEASKDAELKVYQDKLLATYESQTQTLVSSIQAVVDAIYANNGINVSNPLGSGSGALPQHPLDTTTPGTVFSASFANRAAHIDELFKAGDYYGIADYMLRQNGTSKIDAANFLAAQYGFTVQEIMDFFTANGFARGGAFTNGVATRPTMFNMAAMGENGSEGILPLANIGGKLGVYSNNVASREIAAEIRALREEIVVLRTEQRQNTGDTIMANYDAHDRTSRHLSSNSKELVEKSNWLETSKPVLI